MRLPLLGDRDPRAEYSPVWSLQNPKKLSIVKDNNMRFLSE